MTFAVPDPSRSFVQTMYYEARARVLEQGIQSYDEYVDLIEELLQQKMVDGILTKHDDLSQITNDLEMMWPEMKREIVRKG